MLGPILLLALGFVMLGIGAEVLVSGSSRLALRMGVAPLVIGLTIVAFGTSAPELAVSIEAATTGRSAIALGNVIGSNIANIGLILGITALICPIRIEAELIKRQIPIMVGVSVLLCLLLIDGEIGFIDGLILLSGLMGFIYMSYHSTGTVELTTEQSIAETKPQTSTHSSWLNIGFIVGGLAMLVAGSHLFVESAIVLAQSIGISEAVVGLTIVAVGTSVPELATSVVAALRNQSDIATGNVIGSNLFNILGILGVTAVISSVSAAGFSIVDLGVMVAFALILLPLAMTNLTVSRLEGCALVLGYAGYMAYLVL